MTTWQCRSAVAQMQPDQFWLAGRCDGNRVIVYFDAVQFHGTVPSTARKIADPVAGGFLKPVELPPSHVAQFLKGHDEREHFLFG
jgi:hypothetical protein